MINVVISALKNANANLRMLVYAQLPVHTHMW